MKTYFELPNEQDEALPAEFADDDVRYTPGLVRTFLAEYTQPGQLVFDPFAGYGTTLRVAEEMGRRACGLEYDRRRCAYTQTHLRSPESLVCGDARQLSTYGFPRVDFSMTSPPYMTHDDSLDPLTAYSAEGRGYDAYLSDMQAIYRHLGLLMADDAHAVVEVANLKGAGNVTPLAWDLARTLSEVLRFEGEVVIGWQPSYGYGYDHSYCLVFTRP
ncbi:MAG TPA: DNA methyltransferase [Ktedonobacterales bacterium]|nr:DNA methyltransferase [Ktedonobacterales bacterium]